MTIVGLDLVRGVIIQDCNQRALFNGGKFRNSGSRMVYQQEKAWGIKMQ